MDVDARGSSAWPAVSDLSQLQTLRGNIRQPVRVMFHVVL